MKKIKRLLSQALAVCLACSMIFSDAGFTYAAAPETESQELEITQLSNDEVSVDLTGESSGALEAELDWELLNSEESVKVIIVMEGDSIIEEDNSAVLDSETEKKIEELEENQASIIAEIEETVLEGESLEVSYQYTWLLNGVAASVPYAAISDIEALDGVKQVLLQPVYEVCTVDTGAATDISYPMTVSDGVMIGRENAWASGYTGTGMKIAVIDTGIDVDHQNFSALSEDKLTDSSATADTIRGALSSLNAYSRYSGLTVDEVYYSTKIAYGFNYCDNNLDITHDNDTQGDHGTHVAGIAAANQVESEDEIASQVTGVAPDAQLYVMKVFGANGGAYTEDILAALEDALLLGADVVNMSLGSPSGFTTDGEEIDSIYNRVSSTGTILAISAGNAYTAGFGNTWGLNENLTLNPDNATVSSPGTYANALSVASVENVYYPSIYVSVNGSYIGYSDGANGKNEALITLAGQELQIVAVPGTGAAEDYEGLDLEGKIALVQRGVISFGDKCQNAENAGAVACLIYNNESGAIAMDLTGCEATIPCASITHKEGEFIIAALEENDGATVYVGEDERLIASAAASQMSEFSSWGVSPDLSLEPDITAPGGNIYSTTDDGTYGLMSGTSMASPNVAGISALVTQYAKEKGYSGEELHDFVKALLMSTSVPLSYSGNLLYSPRQQGSGLANAYNAVTTQAYLTVDGCDTPKAELKDDPTESGSYSFTFDVHNFGGKALFYDMATIAQTEDIDDTYGDYGMYFMSSTPRALAAATDENSDSMVLKYDLDGNDAAGSHDAYLIYQAAVMGTPEDENWTDVAFRYNLDSNETVDAADVQAYLDALVDNDSPADLTEEVFMVPAGETATVSVSVMLDDADRAYFANYYPYGCYVEGYTLLTALNVDSVDMSLPYLAFYGDWTAADVLDWGYYWDNEDEQVYNQYINALFTQYTYYGQEYGVYPGKNPYVDEEFHKEHISLSPNNDGYADYISDAYIALLRNAAELTFTYTDTETGEVYFEETVEHVSKSSYQTSYGQIIPYVYSWNSEPYELTDENGNALPNNTKLLLTISAVIDYAGAEAQTWEIPITVDTEAPELLSAVRKESGDGTAKIELTFRDNVSVAGVNFLNSTGTAIYGQYLVEDVEPVDGYQTYTVEYDITGYTGKMIIFLGDYAYNESAYAVNLNGEGESYGELVGFQYNEYGDYGSWVSFDKDVNSDETKIFVSEMDFACAEYVNGIVYAQGKDGKLYGFPYEDMLADTLLLETTYITTLENVYQDLAYNYGDGKLYGLYTYEEDWDGEIYATAEIYTINLQGEYWDDDLWATVEAYQEVEVQNRGGLYGLALACDDGGALYILGTVETENEETGEITESTAQLWKASWETEWGYTYLGAFEQVGETGINMNYRQSMTWNHNTETLCWAQFYPVNFATLQSQLVQIDPETAEATILGTLSGETACLFAPLTEEAAAKEEHQNVPEFDADTVGVPCLNQSLLTLNVGGSETLICTFDPWYSRQKDVTWISSDEAVAVVDENGTVTGVNSGSCTITVASVADPTLTDECDVTVSALNLSIQGTVSKTTGGVNNVSDSMLYSMNMEEGAATITTGDSITATGDLEGYGLKLGAATLAKGSIWACEWGNTGMIYQIDPETGVVQDMLQPIDGDMMFGLAYSENTEMFTGIMNFYLYVDLPLTHDVEEEMLNSYDADLGEFTWHKLDLSQYLADSDQNFNTGEAGTGSTVDVVLCGITAIDKPFTFSDETVGMDSYRDYLGNWDYNGNVTYTSDVTYVLLDNVGRLWYVDEIMGLQEEWGDYYSEDDSVFISGSRNGVMSMANGDGTYNVFYLRKVVETPLTDMYRAGTMLRYSYNFSDLYYAGTDSNGSDVFLMSLYDYWNEGSSNEFYLYVTGTTEYDEDTWEPVTVGEMLFDLGNAGAGNIIATIADAVVTGGLPYDVTKEVIKKESTAAVELADETEEFEGETMEPVNPEIPVESESIEAETPAVNEGTETEFPPESEGAEVETPAEDEDAETETSVEDASAETELPSEAEDAETETSAEDPVSNPGDLAAPEDTTAE